MERVETLREKVMVCTERLRKLRGDIRECEESLCKMYAELFFAENGLEDGQRFSINGRVYIAIESDMYGFIRGRYIKKNGDVSFNMTNIPHSDFDKIVPLPMGNDKKEK